MTNDLLKSVVRTEEVQDIIDRMPVKFGLLTTLLIFFLVLVLAWFSWIVRYPDVVYGQLTVNFSQAPIKLVSKVSGKIKLGVIHSQDFVKENQVIAFIENPTSLDDVDTLSKILSSISFPTNDALCIFNSMPNYLSLGELGGSYFELLNAARQLADYQTNKIYDQQIKAFEKSISKQGEGLNVSKNRLKNAIDNQKVYQRIYSRDSLLLSSRAISNSDFDITSIKFINAKDQYQSALREISSIQEQLSQTESKIREICILKIEKERQLNLDFLTTFNDLNDKIRMWRQTYLFTSPMNGRIQFLKFWNDNQFVTSGESVFTIVPKTEAAFGQVIMSSKGAGKVRVGQEVIAKLDDFPYMEYGSIKGLVNSISLTSNSLKSPQGDSDTYLVAVTFPDGLKTNYGSRLSVRSDTKGIAEIVTNDRRLIQRFFDNLKYAVKK